jgi:dephospho-CoA kinase
MQVAQLNTNTIMHSTEPIKIFKNQPIILGLAGKAGSGKTSVAEQIVPKGSIESTKDNIKWDHIFYALPLYELASIKKNTLGMNSKSRKMYAIHQVLYELYGGSPIGFVPDYMDLVSLVKEIESLPIELGGTKPRAFLQKAGDLCRIYRSTVFAEWAVNKSIKSYRSYQKSLDDSSEQEATFCMIVSDVRYMNEAESILKQPNGIVICFEANQETLNARILKRDGKPMSEEHSSHSSENQIELVRNISTAVIITDEMTLEQQTQSTVNLIKTIVEKNNA